MEQPISLKTQSLWLFFAKITSFLLAFVLPLLIVRYLSTEEIGTYRQVFLIIINASTILPLGLPMTAFYFLPREPEHRSHTIFNIMLFNFVVGGIFFLGLAFFPQLLVKIFANPKIEALAPLIGLAVWLWVFSASLEVIAIANQEARLASAFIIFSQLTKTTLMISAVIFFPSVESLLYAAIAQCSLQTTILIYYLKQRFANFWLSFDFSFLRRHFRYALPFGLAGLIWILQTDLHNYFVSYRFGAEKFAIYAYGCFQIPLIAMLRESITSVLIPKMSELQVRNDRSEMLRILAKAMQELAFFYLPIYAFLLVTAETFIRTLFTEKFDDSTPVFLVNLTLLPFEILIIDPIVRAYGELGDLLLKVRIFILVFLIIALSLAIWHLELVGIITIAVSVIIIEKIIFSMIVARKLGMNKQNLKLFKPIAKMALASLIAGLCLIPIYNFSRENFLPSLTESLRSGFFGGVSFLAICLVFFIAVYLTLVFLLIPERRETFQTVRQTLRKFTNDLGL